MNPITSRRGTAFGKGVTTRKFFGKAEIDKPETLSKSKSNSDFIISSATGMKVLSNVTNSAAEHARESLRKFDELVNSTVLNNTEDNKRGSKGSLYDESDLESVQSISADEINNLGKVNQIQNSKIRDSHKSAIRNILKNGTIGSSLAKKPNASKVNKAVPMIDYATVQYGKKGVGDKFSVNITFILEANLLENDNIKAVRVFRSKKEVPESTRDARPRLSRLGMDIIAAQPSRTRLNNQGSFGNSQQQRLDERGVKNALSDMTKVDELTGNRNSLKANRKKESNTDNEIEEDIVDRDSIGLSSYIRRTKGLHLDPSVIRNLKAMRNIQIQNPNLAINNKVIGSFGSAVVNRDAIGRLSDRQITQARRNDKKKSNAVASEYKELANLPIARIRSKRINSLVEFYYEDVTVELGETYTYYIITTDSSSTESIRSRIVKVTIEEVIPPPKPLRLSAIQNGPIATLNILQENGFNIEKFEIYRKESGSNKLSKNPVEITVLNGPNGFTTERVLREPIGNGYVQVGESQIINNSGATFIDRGVVEGKKYTYRVYSVDIFGNKSQCPSSVNILVNERQSRSADLKKPTAITEVSAGAEKVKITVSNSDDRLVGFFISRKNHTLNEKSFTAPGQQSHIKRGSSLIGGNKFNNSLRDSSWTGFVGGNKRQFSFEDNTVRVDNTYQYCVYGIDRFGRKTSCEITDYMFVSRRPIVERPINLSAEINEEKVKIIWEDGNLDIDPQDRIGNRDDLNATSKRTLFQVERRKQTEERWSPFPLVETLSVDDKIGKTGEKSPPYRPDYLEIDSEYLYRVAAFQTGGYISNFSNPIVISTIREVSQPTNFRVKTCDSKCEPFFVALNWDTPKESGTVDKWIIERAAVNNFSAASFNVTNPDEVSRLDFETVSEVLKESSRSRSRVDEERSESKDTRKNRVLSSEHHYIDDDIEFGNTYFYRLTAVGLKNESTSSPITRGIKVTDPVFDRKLNNTITQVERNVLSKSTQQINLKVDLRKNGNRKSKKGI